MSANCPEAIAIKLERLVARTAEEHVFVERAELRRLLTEHRYLEGQLQIVANRALVAEARLAVHAQDGAPAPGAPDGEVSS